MNTPERNNKNIDKMHNLGKVYSESDEDKGRENDSALENATREYPLPTARKFAWVICGGFWLFCLSGLLFRADLSALFPFLLLSLAAAVSLQIPVFYVKGKIFDIVVAVIFSLGCGVFAASMLFGR
ncbi:MAG: hypothetical protein FWF94_01110 [Oscillospiraceae bacterium]|nr:hypothetical protein [Oscillospiraceae bacterium]